MRSSRGHRTKSEYAQISSRLRRWSLRILDGLDAIVYAAVGIAFVGAAFLALAYSVVHLLSNFGVSIPLDGAVQNVLTFVSDLLLVLIIMEVLGTIRSYLQKGDTSVKPFLFIGIISATRGILSIGARLSIQGADLTIDQFRSAMIELGVNAAVIIALGVTIRVLGTAADIPQDGNSASLALSASPEPSSSKESGA